MSRDARYNKYKIYCNAKLPQIAKTASKNVCIRVMIFKFNVAF